MFLKNSPFVSMLLTSLVLAGATGLINPAVGVAATPTDVLLKKGMSYKDARPLILKAGWKPNLEGRKNLRDRRVKSIYDSGMVEIEDCSGTGEAPCRYGFVNAQGDEFRVVTVVRDQRDGFVKSWGITKKAEKPQANRSRAYIGLAYRNLPEGLESSGGAMIDDGYSVGIVRRGNTDMVWLEKTIQHDSEGHSTRQVLDVLELPEIKQPQQLSYRFCQLNGTSDREIVAIVEQTDTEYYTNVYQAWRANIKTGKIEPMVTKGIACSNSGWGS
jgi:hypothetical protein